MTTWHVPHYFPERSQAITYIASQCGVLACASLQLPTETWDNTVHYRVWRHDGWVPIAMARFAHLVSSKNQLCRRLRTRVLQRRLLAKLLALR
jgi:hypothetical protein